MRVVAALTIAALVALLATGASATTGPGGWDNLGTGATPTTHALNGGVYALNANAPGLLYAGGAFTDTSGDPNADYIASWNGTKWAKVASPNPDPSQTFNYLLGVSTVSPTSAFAVGTSVNQTTGVYTALTARWNGRKWI